jgi:hypothetical protein
MMAMTTMTTAMESRHHRRYLIPMLANVEV